jgi:hypothetical protein
MGQPRADYTWAQTLEIERDGRIGRCFGPGSS